MKIMKDKFREIQIKTFKNLYKIGGNRSTRNILQI